MRTENFGKDLGLMHEVVLTGRQVGMGTVEYAFLAQSKEWFAKVANLCRHLAVIERHQIAIETVDNEKAEKLIAGVATIVNADSSGCITCGWNNRWSVASMFVPEDILEKHATALKQVERSGRESLLWRQIREYQEYFCRWICDCLEEIGLHPAELSCFLDVFVFVSTDDSQELKLSEQGCETADRFGEAIRQLVAQRKILSQMNSI